MPGLGPLLDRAEQNGVFGTKMRSLIKRADGRGVKAVVDQQFETSLEILATDLTPIVEPEVDVHSAEKAEAEALLKAAILMRLGQLHRDQHVVLKLTLPEFDDRELSRAMTDGISVHQTDEEFDVTLDESIASIYAASIT